MIVFVKSLKQCKMIFALMLIIVLSVNLFAQNKKLSANGVSVPDWMLKCTILSSDAAFGSMRTLGDVIGEPEEGVKITKIVASENDLHLEFDGIIMNGVIDVKFAKRVTCYISHIKVESPLTFSVAENECNNPNNAYSYGRVLGLFKEATNMFFVDKVAEAEKNAAEEKRLAEEKAAEEAKAELEKNVKIWKENGVPAGNVKEFISAIPEETIDNLKIIGKIAEDDFSHIRSASYSKKIKVLDLSNVEGLTKIPSKAFYSSYSEPELESVILPDSVEEIGAEAFYGCKNLKSIVFPKNLKAIGDSAFSSCNLESITLPESLKEIGEYAFSYCNLKSIVLPKNLQKIGYNSFRNCPLESVISYSVFLPQERYYWLSENIKSIVLPEGLTKINKSVFNYRYKLENVTFPESLQEIGEGAFSRCKNIKSIVLTKNLTSIGDCAFESCSIETIEFSASVKTIGNYSFADCPITSITFSASLQEIGKGAFYNCPIETVTFKGSKKQWKAVKIGSDNEALKKAKIIFTEK